METEYEFRIYEDGSSYTYVLQSLWDGTLYTNREDVQRKGSSTRDTMGYLPDITQNLDLSRGEVQSMINIFGLDYQSH